MTVEAPRLSRFDGPLDLLLELINRRTLDITTISLAAVAEQYLDEVSRLGETDLERLAGYLVIASRLLLIKSQALLPRPPTADEDEDTGADLVRQLEEYRRFKAVAQHLRKVEEQRTRSFPRQAVPQVAPSLTPGAGHVTDLVSAFARALSLAPEAPPTQTLTPPRFRVADKVRDLAQRLDVTPELDFSGVVEGASCRAEVVAYFLALLEMLRRGRALVWQQGLFGRITLAKPSGLDQAGEGNAEDSADGVDADVDDTAVTSVDEELVQLIASGIEHRQEPGD
jgi:segregation and condensation protein A